MLSDSLPDMISSTVEKEVSARMDHRKSEEDAANRLSKSMQAELAKLRKAVDAAQSRRLRDQENTVSKVLRKWKQACISTAFSAWKEAMEAAERRVSMRTCPFETEPPWERVFEHCPPIPMPTSLRTRAVAGSAGREALLCDSCATRHRRVDGLCAIREALAYRIRRLLNWHEAGSLDADYPGLAQGSSRRPSSASAIRRARPCNVDSRHVRCVLLSLEGFRASLGSREIPARHGVPAHASNHCGRTFHSLPDVRAGDCGASPSRSPPRRSDVC